MDTLLDYVKWMEDFDFRTVPLREADVLVMCLIAYFDLTPVFPKPITGAGGQNQTALYHREAPVYVRDMAPLVDRDKAKLLIIGGDMGNRAVFSAAVHSRRFGLLRMTNCVDVIRQGNPLQFAAVTFQSDDFSLIAYRGTDSSLVGWKENFMISFTRTRAQEMAAEYANRVIAAADRPCYLAGHSKGGNLALFAGCSLTDANLKKTAHIYILDGPGLCPEVVDPAMIRRIDSRTTAINPVFDIIGKMFEPGLSDVRIISSCREGVAQHSLPSWQIDHGKLALVPANSPHSLRLNLIFNEWIRDKSPEVRRTVIDELFEAIAEQGVTNLENMRLENLVEVMIHLRSASETTSEALKELQHRLLSPEELFRPSLEKARDNLNNLKNSLEQHAANRNRRGDKKPPFI